jgi:hypothetical protein
MNYGFGPVLTQNSYSFFVVLGRGTLYSFSLITETLLPVDFFLIPKAHLMSLIAVSE